jgi:2-polyprenyl-6-methoxyphenol hydroxylase-like FAD-dependent oxidoreductase
MSDDSAAPGIRKLRGPRRGPSESRGDTITPRLLYTLPAGHQWTCQRGVTLLGDAAHLMTPFGCNGVNFAMLDAAELAIANTTAPIRSRPMRLKYASAPAPEAAEALNSLMETFSEAGPRHWLDQLSGDGGASTYQAGRQS